MELSVPVFRKKRSECRRSLEELGSGRLVRPCQDFEEPWQEVRVPAEWPKAVQRAQAKILEACTDHFRFLIWAHLQISTESCSVVLLLVVVEAVVPCLYAGDRVSRDGNGGSSSSGRDSGRNNNGSSSSVDGSGSDTLFSER